jgi:hypothetical protein
MNATELSAIAGVILSLVFAYIPGLSGWFDAKAPTEKRLLMATVLLVTVAGIFGLSCANVLGVASCDKPGVLGIVSALIAALVANQSTYLISPKPAE